MRPSSRNGKLWMPWACLALVLALGAAPAALAATATADDAAAAAPLANLLDTEPAQSVEPAPMDELESLFQEPTALPTCGFPPPPPPSYCTCGGCCECNRCWNGGFLAKCLDRS